MRESLIDEPTRVARQAVFVFLIWALYLAEAIVGTWMALRWRLQALYVPCLTLCLAIVADQLRPLSLEEERESQA
jgi:hypothetical protein